MSKNYLSTGLESFLSQDERNFVHGAEDFKDSATYFGEQKE